MTQTEFQQMLVDLMKQGLEIKMFIRADELWFDLCTGMKSHLHLSYCESIQAARYKARYDKTGIVTDMDDLLDEVRQCNYGRDFSNPVWFHILKGKLS